MTCNLGETIMLDDDYPGTSGLSLLFSLPSLEFICNLTCFKSLLRSLRLFNLCARDSSYLFYALGYS